MIAELTLHIGALLGFGLFTFVWTKTWLWLVKTGG